jgi:hypothetical protein
MERKTRCRTIFSKNSIETEVATNYYNRLLKLPWQEGIRSKNGFTRLEHNLDLCSRLGEEILALIREILREMKRANPAVPNYAIFGVYVNYYRDGDMYTPNHSHKGTHQLVLSFGATRTLNIGKKSFLMENGDAILFGSTIHGVPREKTDGGRISVATFMVPIP